MPENGKVIENPDGKLDLNNAKFHYPTKPDVQVLNGVNIAIPANKVIAFVGASGKFILKFWLKLTLSFY